MTDSKGPTPRTIVRRVFNTFGFLMLIFLACVLLVAPEGQHSQTGLTDQGVAEFALYLVMMATCFFIANYVLTDEHEEEESEAQTAKAPQPKG